jgi:hypothetical protein
MRNTYIADHLSVARLGAIASNDTLLVYLIDMALSHEAQKARPHKASKVA